MKLDYFLIDAIAPFFVVPSDAPETNWSKVPFTRIENDGTVDHQKALLIEEAFGRYINAVTAAGYNAITLDDMAHLVNHSFYPAHLNDKIDSYRSLYARLIAYAGAKGCSVFITSDILFLNRYI